MIATGAVNLTATRPRWANLSPPGVNSGHEGVPLGRCNGAAGLASLSVDQVAFEVEVIVDACVD
jgi:hypothetical protein